MNDLVGATPRHRGRRLRVLVAGGREYADREKVYRVLDRIHERAGIGVIVHGDAPGADRLAADWCRERGVADSPYPIYEGDMSRYGNRAGNARNSRMLRQGCPDLAVCFPGHGGTADMRAKIKDAGVKLVTVKP